MSVNKYLPHLYVLPEDDANRQLVNGFLLDPSLSARQVYVLEVAGGWRNVLDHFASDHVSEMKKYGHRFMILLIDFDGRGDRLGAAKAVVPQHLIERVFILGVWSEPEKLRASVSRSYEQIGMEMAKECREGSDATWGSALLQHNADEIERLREHVRPILFPSD